MITLVLTDGQTISDLRKNGNNYISETEIDESIFTNNLYTLTIKEEGEPDIVMRNAYLVQQVHYKDGYYLCFAEKSKEDLMRERISDLEDAMIEVYEMGI